MDDHIGRLAQIELVEQFLEALAVLGEIDRVRRSAEDRHAFRFQFAGQLERGLAAILNHNAQQGAIRALGLDQFERVLDRQRLEIEAVGGVVIGRDGFRIAVHHDGLDIHVGEGKGGVAAAIIEFDALADPVGSATEDDRLFASGRFGLAFDAAIKGRRFVAGIHIGCRRGEFGGAGVDALEDGAHAQRAAGAAHGGLVLIGQLRQARIGEAHRLEGAEGGGIGRKTERRDVALDQHDFFDLAQEPGFV